MRKCGRIGGVELALPQTPETAAVTAAEAPMEHSPEGSRDVSACYTLGHEVLCTSMASETNPNFMNGVPELLILKLLQHEEMYGYEIVQAIRSRSDAVITVGEGVVYPVLHGLERAGALRSRRKTVNGRRRIYYSVTQKGSRRLAELSGDWNQLADAIRKVMGGKHAEAIS